MVMKKHVNEYVISGLLEYKDIQMYPISLPIFYTSFHCFEVQDAPKLFHKLSHPARLSQAEAEGCEPTVLQLRDMTAPGTDIC